MPITYKQSHTSFQLVLDGLIPDQRVLLFDPQLERSAVPAGDRFRALDAALRDADLIVIRGAESSIKAMLCRDPVIQSAIESTPIAVLYAGSEGHSLTPTIELLAGSTTQKMLPDLDSLRQAELTSIFTRTGAVFSGQTYHFALPSGHHADRFIRLGDALRDLIELRRIADWLMPFLTETTAVLGDSGSILPLITEVANRAFRQFGWQIPYDCLSQYPVDRREIQQRIADVRRTAPDHSQLLFVVSVNSSGQTIALVNQATRNSASLVTVCDTHGGEISGTVLSTLSVQRWQSDSRGRCEECKNSPAMSIDPQTYERIPSFDWNLVRLRHDRVQSEREFWEIADEVDAVGLHVSRPYQLGDVTEQRHFGVFLDTVKLANHSGFRQKCISELSKFPRPDIILVPDHASAEAPEIVINASHPDVIPIRIAAGPLQPAIIERLRAASCIWIVDDAVVSGATLRGFRTCVYNAVREVTVLPEIYAFALLARTSTDAELKAVRQPYYSSDGSHFAFGAKVSLPRPGRENCPWCQEQSLLTELLNDLSASQRQTALERIRQLDTPLDPPFLVGAGQHGAAELVTSGSFFGDLHQKSAFASCVGAVQALLDTFRTAHTSEVIDVIDLPMIVSAYFEAVFSSAIMRTCTRAQLWCPKSEPALTEALHNVDRSRLLPATIAEIGVAAALGKLPAPAVVDLIEVAIRSDADPVLPMLLELIRLNIQGRIMA